MSVDPPTYRSAVERAHQILDASVNGVSRYQGFSDAMDAALRILGEALEQPEGVTSGARTRAGSRPETVPEGITHWVEPATALDAADPRGTA